MINYSQPMPASERLRLSSELGLPLHGVSYSDIISQIENYLLEAYEQATLPDVHPHSSIQIEKYQEWKEHCNRIADVFFSVTGVKYPFIESIS